MLPPPQATGRNVAAITSKPSNQSRWRFLLIPTIKTQPANPNGSQEALSTFARLNGCGSNSAVSPGEFNVIVALPPAFNELGEIPHMSMGAGPLTEQANMIVPEKPPCALVVRVSVVWPPRFTVRLLADALSEKSGAGLNVAVRDWSEFIVIVQLLGSLPKQAPLQPPCGARGGRGCLEPSPESHTALAV